MCDGVRTPTHPMFREVAAEVMGAEETRVDWSATGKGVLSNVSATHTCAHNGRYLCMSG